MRINTFARQKHNNYPSGNRKRQANTDKHADDFNDNVTLSPEIQLLNKLLDLPENHFTPYPFYFVNAAVKNIKTLCQIATRIQNTAEDLGVKISQNMIYDLLIGKASQSAGNPYHWAHSPSNITSEKDDLSENEKKLFEKFHSLCIENKLSTQVVELLATEYIKKKHNSGVKAFSTTDQITILYGILYTDGSFQQLKNYNKVFLSLVKHLQ